MALVKKVFSKTILFALVFIALSFNVLAQPPQSPPVKKLRGVAELAGNALGISETERMKKAIEEISKSLKAAEKKLTQANPSSAIPELQAAHGDFQQILQADFPKRESQSGLILEKINKAQLQLRDLILEMGGTVEYVEDDGALRSSKIETPHGNLKVYVPSVIGGGDRISGTVVQEPQGKSIEEKASNRGRLQGYVVEIESDKDTVQYPVVNSRIEWLAPSLFSAATAFITIKDESGRVQSRVPLSKFDSSVFNHFAQDTTEKEFSVPSMGQISAPIAIAGNFDGSFVNSKVTLGQTELQPLAESPRVLIVDNSNTIVGVDTLKVSEENSTFSAPFRSIDVSLTADRTTIEKGNQANVYVVVSGLDSLHEPLPMTLANETPSIISVEGGDYQTIKIESTEVTKEGTFQEEVTITGNQAGAFSLLASVEIAEAQDYSPGTMTKMAEIVESIQSVFTPNGSDFSPTTMNCDDALSFSNILQVADSGDSKDVNYEAVPNIVREKKKELLEKHIISGQAGKSNYSWTQKNGTKANCTIEKVGENQFAMECQLVTPEGQSIKFSDNGVCQDNKVHTETMSLRSPGQIVDDLELSVSMLGKEKLTAIAIFDCKVKLVLEANSSNWSGDWNSTFVGYGDYYEGSKNSKGECVWKLIARCFIDSLGNGWVQWSGGGPLRRIVRGHLRD